VKVTDYFPTVFRRIRESVGIDSQDFLVIFNFLLIRYFYFYFYFFF